MSGSKYVRGMLLSKRLVKLAFLHFRPFSLSLPLLLSPFSTRETSYLNAPIGLHVSPFADEIRSRFDVLSSGPVTIHHRVRSTDLLSYAGVLFMTRTEIEDPLSLRPEIRFILQRRR